jgi:hypothetical protein
VSFDHGKERHRDRLGAEVKIFLSHAHSDAAKAQWLATELHARLIGEGFSVEIFNTSEPQYHFPDLSTMLQHGDDWAAVGRGHAEALRAYLDEQITEAAAYLLLVTPQTAKTSRPWIRWEIDNAGGRARERGLPFIPCLLGVRWEDLWAMSSAPAGSPWQEHEVGPSVGRVSPAEFQGVRLDEPEGIDRVVEGLRASLAQ